MSIYSLSRLCSDFFSPLPSHPVRYQAPHPPKELCDIVTAYFTSNGGSRDLFRLFEYALSFLHLLPVCPQQKEGFAHGASVMNKAGNALSAPRIITDITDFKNSVYHIRDVYNDPQANSHQVAHAYRASVCAVMSTVNDVTQAAEFLHDVSIIHLGKYYQIIEWFYNFSNIVYDGIGLIGAGYELHHSYAEPVPADNHAAQELREKRVISWLKIAKDVPSIVESVIAIAAIFFASLQVPAVAVISLGLNTMWLSMKMTSVFYEKYFIEARRRRV